MKILVGVMYCIENEFDRCLQAIDGQTYSAYDRFVVSQLPNKEAHDRLYTTFMARAAEVDLFVKIDADMVLSRPTFFAELVDYFTQRPELTHVQIHVDDWFTKRRIMGVHAYRSSHRWVRNEEAYFVDMVDAGGTLVSDTQHLAPAAAHCPDPSPFQAFHFGVHKAAKVLQLDRPELHLQQSCTHWGHFSRLETIFAGTQDHRIGLATAGFLHAIAHRYGPDEVDYTNPITHAAFAKYEGLSVSALKRACRRLGPYAWTMLPLALRYELARWHATRPLGTTRVRDVVVNWRADRFNRHRTDV